MTDAEEFVAALPQETRAITRALRTVARRSMPKAVELVYHDALGYSTTTSPADRVVYIWPARDHVTFGFFFGGRLKDPKGLLEGRGGRMRHVKVRSAAEARAPALASLAREAWSRAADDIASIRRRPRPA